MSPAQPTTNTNNTFLAKMDRAALRPRFSLGLSAWFELRQSAYWASWAEILQMVMMRHRAIEDLSAGEGQASLRSAEACRRDLRGGDGVRTSILGRSGEGTRPPPPPLDEDPRGWRTRWQHEAACRVERQYREVNVLPRVVPWQGLPSQRCRSVSTRALSRICFVCCCFAVFACRSFLLHTHADVAATWTPLATIGLRVLGRACWRDEGSQWSWPQPSCVGKLEHGSRPTS